MSIRPRHITREVGTALAVLAVYVLVLLAPLHQAAGLQRDLSQLGYESQWSLSVCASVGEAGDPDTPTAIKCPLASAGKFDLAVLVPPSPDFERLGAANVPAPVEQAVTVFGAPNSAIWPRGPPATA